MRKRCLLWLVAAVLLYTLYVASITKLLAPFGDELGSVAYPVPAYLDALGLSALASAVIGLAVLVRDFLNRQRTKPYD